MTLFEGKSNIITLAWIGVAAVGALRHSGFAFVYLPPSHRPYIRTADLMQKYRDDCDKQAFNRHREQIQAGAAHVSYKQYLRHKKWNGEPNCNEPEEIRQFHSLQLQPDGQGDDQEKREQAPR